MKQKQRNEKVYRSMEEFKKHLLPNLYKRELEEERGLDPKIHGIGCVDEFLENVGRSLRKPKWVQQGKMEKPEKT